MSNRLAILATAALAAFSALGCASGGLQQQVDELTLQNEELARQKAQTEAELLSAHSRIEGLELEKAKLEDAAAAGVARTPYQPKPDTTGLDVKRRGEDTVINLPTDLFFSSGSATLSATGERSMAQVARYLKENHPAGRIRVEGHSDSDPIRRTKDKWHCNWALSFERAHAVLHHLVEKGGIAPGRIICESHAEHDPAAPGDKAKNRRVEVVVSP
jgi:flagellar motor protein MotB